MKTETVNSADIKEHFQQHVEQTLKFDPVDPHCDSLDDFISTRRKHLFLLFFFYLFEVEFEFH